MAADKPARPPPARKVSALQRNAIGGSEPTGDEDVYARERFANHVFSHDICRDNYDAGLE